VKTLRGYLARDIIRATALVAGALLGLFAFFDLLQELKDVGKGDYGLLKVVAYVLLTLPGRLYEILPIAVLIGSLYALTLLAQHSEITVMRASGLSTAAMLGLVAQTGTIFVVLTLLIGEYVAPPSEQAAQRLRVRAQSGVIGQGFRSGIWLKEENAFINLQSVSLDARVKQVRIYEFDANYALVAISDAAEGEYVGPNTWRLRDVVRTVFSNNRANVERLPELRWHSALSPDILSVLLVVPERMSLIHLYKYISHLAENQQKTGRYEIAFWKKLVYPFAAWVMMALAIPFAFRHHRLAGVSIRVFAGVMIGIFFHMLNGLFSNLGIINNWPPFFSAITPSLLFLAAAAAMLWWEERR